MNKHYLETIDETIYTQKLPNGLDVFILPKQDVSKVYSIFMTDYGSIDRTFVPLGKTDEVTVPDGIAHFLEHKLFEKETTDVMMEFSKRGASINAFTSFSKTAYLFSATDNITENLTTLLDFVQEPYFSDESVEKEKGIIVQELKMYQDQANWMIFSGTIKNMFENHPVHIDILGTEESIHAITKEDLYTCYETFYHPENMAIFVIGNVDATEIGKLIEENQAAKEFAAPAPIVKGTYEEPEKVRVSESVIQMPVTVPKVAVGVKESAHLLDGMAAVKREMIQQLLLDYLFAESGLFYEELYDEGIIDDSFGYHSTMETQYGYSMISGDSENPKQFAERIKDILLEAKDIELDEAAFNRAKNKQIGFGLRAMNSLEFVAREYVSHHLMGVDFFQRQQILESISLHEVQTFLSNWITQDQLTVCIVQAD